MAINKLMTLHRFFEQIDEVLSAGNANLPIARQLFLLDHFNTNIICLFKQQS